VISVIESLTLEDLWTLMARVKCRPGPQAILPDSFSPSPLSLALPFTRSYNTHVPSDEDIVEIFDFSFSEN
jgi:hypothetical protein